MALRASDEERLRKLELDHAGLLPKVESLFDNQGSPGLLSQLRISLSQKIDEYCLTVSKFIEGEPARKSHIERNAAQSVLDAKVLAQDALDRSDEKQLRLHEENRRSAEKDRAEIADLRKSLERHEKFVQRGVGIVIFGQILIFAGGFIMTFLAFVGGFAWWFFTHVAVRP